MTKTYEKRVPGTVCKGLADEPHIYMGTPEGRKKLGEDYLRWAYPNGAKSSATFIKLDPKTGKPGATILP